MSDPSAQPGIPSSFFAPSRELSPPRARPDRRVLLATLAGLLALHVLLAAPPSPGGAALSPQSIRLGLDPNTASAADLALLPGFGPTRAQRVVDFRSQCGRTPAFAELSALGDIRGIGPGTLDRVRPYLQFPAPSADRDSGRAGSP